MSRPFPFAPNELLRRLLASGVAALVLALTVFAASPTAHDWVHHGHDHAPATDAPGEHACAIVLFAGGVALPVGALSVAAPHEFTQDLARGTAADVDLVAPRYLRQPERGPPQA